MTWRVSVTDTAFRLFQGMQAVGAETRLDGRLPWSAGGLEAELEMLRAICEIPAPPPCPHPQLWLSLPTRDADTEGCPSWEGERVPQFPSLCPHLFRGVLHLFRDVLNSSPPPFLHHWPHLLGHPRPITPCCLGDCKQNYLQKSHLWIRVITVFIRKPGLLFLFSGSDRF